MMAEVELESKAEGLLFSRVKGLGGMCIKIHPLVKGNPDRLILLHGIHLVELKRPGGLPSIAQRAWHLKAQKAGVQIHVVVGTAGVRSWLRAVVNANSAPRKAGRPRKDCTCGGTSDALRFFNNTRFWDGSEAHPCDHEDDEEMLL